MRPDEKSALGRVLNISRAAYSAAVNGGLDNTISLLDSLSAALSHTGDEKRPLSKCMRALKHEIKAKNKAFYISVKPQFSRIVPVLDYDYEEAKKHIPAIIYGNDMICQKIVTGEHGKARSMADAMKSYPGYIFGEFSALSGEQFYDLVFGYYPKLYDEPFMEEMRGLFTKNTHSDA